MTKMSKGARGGRATAPDAYAADVINAYLANQPATVRRVLEALRLTIQAAATDATESISYGMPAFRLHGRPLVAFGAASEHCAFYPMSPAVVAAHKRQLEPYSTSKGTIRFTSERPLPAVLVKRLVRARAKELSDHRRHDSR
jgi:uncharacterized protein YdhG (YjbR/CyaY superfamily)